MLILLGKLRRFVSVNLVFVIAAVAAVITSCIIPPDRAYLSYPDFRTLTCLFCTLAVIKALGNIGFFYALAKDIVRRFGNLRTAVLALVYITFIGSMLIANDMALLTFLPLGYFVLRETKNEHHMAFTFIMQNIAANLGGMLTPFGNPQNLYLYSFFSIPAGEFVSIMLLPFLLSVALITLCCIVFTPAAPLTLTGEMPKLPGWRTAAYLILFGYSIAIVFRGVPYYTGLIVIPLALLLLDRRALAAVDYPLLGTFMAFFIFAGNMGRMEAVQELFSAMLEKSTLLVSALCCQLISNVPSAILLSRFTENYADLLIGVNIGGCGTLIASLASLITFRSYLFYNPGKAVRYIALFSAFNFGFLAVLAAVMLLVRG